MSHMKKRMFRLQQPCTPGLMYFCCCRDLNMTMSTSKRVAMYVLPVVVLSIALNIPKFMEATASVENDTVTIEMAEMRRQPTYVLYFTISQERGSIEFYPPID